MKASRVEIRGSTDVVTARRDGRDMARVLGFGSADQTRLATAISELTRNVVQYAGSGFCEIENASSPNFMEVRVVVGDSGPGIPDLGEALRDGFSTGGGLGAGLPGTRRLVHSFDIISEPGNTRVEITVRRRRS
ncbi:MAG: anti-sigma regulatory factor [Deltaproteobacteria bacterium]|nr:anti-sigma regulatory factor [Deltaproteobacteria bacterium]